MSANSLSSCLHFALLLSLLWLGTSTACSAQDDLASQSDQVQSTVTAGGVISGVSKAAAQAAAVVAAGQNTDRLAAADLNAELDNPQFLSLPPGNVMHIQWTSGEQSEIRPQSDGSFKIKDGPAKGTSIKPLKGGCYYVDEPGGKHALMSPTMDGGWKITGQDGSLISLNPTANGGFTMSTTLNRVGTILPGPELKRKTANPNQVWFGFGI